MNHAVRSHDRMASLLTAFLRSINEDKNSEQSSPVPENLKAGDMIA